MTERFASRMADYKVAHDVATVGDFVQIFCDGHHADAPRRRVVTDAAEMGVYGKKHPVLCDECEAHLAYAEKRRAYCSQDPKPFCAHCEVHCYSPDERVWQQAMMRYSGHRSLGKGHVIDGLRHMIEGLKYHRQHARSAAGGPRH